MSTRTVNINLVEQSPEPRMLRFVPDLTSLGDDTLLLAREYRVTTASDGTATINLPVKASGSVRYIYNIPGNMGNVSTGIFYLSAGSPINLEDLIAAGGSVTPTLSDYVDSKIDDTVYGVSWLGDTTKAPSKNAVYQAIAANPGAVIGGAVSGATANSVPYIDGGGTLAESPSRFIYDNTYGNQGGFKLGNVSEVYPNIDKNVSLLQVTDQVGYAGNLDRSYFGIFTSVNRTGNNSFWQTSAIRGRARLSGSSLNYPAVTGGEFFSDNQGDTGGTSIIQGAEGLATAYANAEEIQAVYGQAGTSGAGVVVNTRSSGVIGIGSIGAGGSTPELNGVLGRIGGGGTSTHAAAVNAVVWRNSSNYTNLYGLRVAGWFGTGTIANSYGIYIDTSIDSGATNMWAIKSDSISPSVFAGSISVPDDALDSSWASDASVPNKKAIYDLALSPASRKKFISFFQDFQQILDGRWSVSNSGSGGFWSQDSADQLGIGVVKHLTGTTLATTGMIDSNEFIIFGQTARSMEARMRLAQLSDATNTYTASVGFVDPFNAPNINNGVMFQYSHGVNGGKWQAVTKNNTSGLSTTADTGVLADTAFHVFKVVVNATGTQADFYIDGTLVATVTSNINTTLDEPHSVGYNWHRTAGTSGFTTTYFDYIASYADLSGLSR